jgi:hypothetical protein
MNTLFDLPYQLSKSKIKKSQTNFNSLIIINKNRSIQSKFIIDVTSSY